MTVVCLTLNKSAESILKLLTYLPAVSDVIKTFFQDQDLNFKTKTKPSVQDQDFASRDKTKIFVMYTRGRPKRMFHFRPQTKMPTKMKFLLRPKTKIYIHFCFG